MPRSFRRIPLVRRPPEIRFCHRRYCYYHHYYYRYYRYGYRDAFPGLRFVNMLSDVCEKPDGTHVVRSYDSFPRNVIIVAKTKLLFRKFYVKIYIYCSRNSSNRPITRIRNELRRWRLDIFPENNSSGQILEIADVKFQSILSWDFVYSDMYKVYDFIRISFMNMCVCLCVYIFTHVIKKKTPPFQFILSVINVK